MTKQEAGRLGGLATYQKYGHWHMVTIGKVGKETTIQRHGIGYWEGLISRKGWAGPRRSSLGADLAAAAQLRRWKAA